MVWKNGEAICQHREDCSGNILMGREQILSFGHVNFEMLLHIQMKMLTRKLDINLGIQERDWGWR